MPGVWLGSGLRAGIGTIDLTKCNRELSYGISEKRGKIGITRKRASAWLCDLSHIAVYNDSGVSGIPLANV